MQPHKVNDAKALATASSPTAIRQRFLEVAKRIRRYKRWLHTDHRYNNDVLAALAPAQNQGDVDGPLLAEYIASSAPLHLADGWNYLSRAFDAASRGDRSSAYHLSYYAELRAAMSLLAAEGIGIFNNRHYAIDSNLEPFEYPGGTHQAAWQILSAWAQIPGRASNLLDSISVESKSLSAWLSSIGVVTPSQQIVAQEWLNSWSIDLNVFSQDRVRRNENSYRPTRIRTPAPSAVKPRPELVTPLFTFWEQLEPQHGGTRATLDVTLLNRALQLVVNKGICNYSTVRQALNAIRKDMSTPTYQVLSNSKSGATPILRAAADQDFYGKPATPILARSLLMLRLASASTASLLSSVGLSKEDLAFWWDPLGRDLGLWKLPNDFDLFSDLWNDVSDARDDARVEISNIEEPGTVREIGAILAGHISLTQFTRAPMWLLELD